MNLLINPFTRVFCLIAILAVCIVNQSIPFQILLLIFLICILAVFDKITGLLKFIVIVVLPYACILFLTWGLNDNEAPEIITNYQKDGLHFALHNVLRIILIAGVIQFFTGTINKNSLVSFWKYLGFSNNAIVVFQGSIGIIPDIAKRARRLIDSRFSKEKARSRNFFQRLIQFPYILRPLISKSLIDSFERIEYWKQNSIPIRIQYLNEKKDYSMRRNDYCTILIATIICVTYLTSLFYEI